MKINKSLAIILTIVTMAVAFVCTTAVSSNTSASAATNVSIKLNQKKTSSAYQKKAIAKLNQKLSSSNAAAKKWIASHESHGSYSAHNGLYYGKYQLKTSLLHGNYSALNQEKAADKYVKSRYGSWANAKKHWLSTNWY